MSKNQKPLIRETPFFALPLTLLGIGLVLLPQLGFTFPSAPMSLTVIGTTPDAVNEVRAELDVHTHLQENNCEAWSGYLDGKNVAVGVAAVDDTERCTTWLLDHYPTRALLVIDPTAPETNRLNAIANAREIPVLNAADGSMDTVAGLLQRLNDPRGASITSIDNP